MKFENNKTQNEILTEIIKQADNPYARIDEDNPWAQIACVILKNKKSKSLKNLTEKIIDFRYLMN
jgi:hypothetical protein